jgi:hypothetical protein
MNVHCPFRLAVPEGTSTFTLLIPREFVQDRQFYFADLSLAPDYYNTKSAQEGMDTDQELDSTTTHQIYITSLSDEQKLFSDAYELKQMMTIPNYVKEINTFFENHKPEGIKHSVIFYDWIDTAQEESGMDLDEYIQELAIMLYDEAYDPAKHYNALPMSVRKLTKSYPINNYLYPTKKDPELVKRLRWRLWLGPNTWNEYSTDVQLKAMGFSEEQIGKRKVRKKFIFDNANLRYNMMKAQNHSSDSFPTATAKVKVQVSDDTFVSDPILFTTTIRDSLKNTKIEKAVKDALAIVCENSNYNITFSYKEDTKTFNFAFPNNSNLKLTLNVTIDLATLLGYDAKDKITQNDVPNPRPDTIDVKEAGELSRTLAFDTGLVIVEVENIASNTTSGINNQFMASLYPNESGILTLSSTCYSPPTIKIPSFMTGSSVVPVTFRLSRFIQDHVLTPLVWKTGAFVNGEFRGSRL